MSASSIHETVSQPGYLKLQAADSRATAAVVARLDVVSSIAAAGSAAMGLADDGGHDIDFDALGAAKAGDLDGGTRR